MEVLVQPPVMFSATWCGHCTRLKQQLGRLGVAFETIDIDEEPEHLPALAEANGGDWLIPTVRFADGSVLVNPPAAEVARRFHAHADPTQDAPTDPALVTEGG